MKKESIFKFILLCFIICFLVILFAGKTGYYEKKLRDNSILTEEQIKKFEKAKYIFADNKRLYSVEEVTELRITRTER